MQKRILIIDDEVDICFLLSAMLRRQDFEVQYCNSLSEVSQFILSFKPSLIFMDINLPDGISLDRIRDIKGNSPDVKIVIISAYDGQNEKLRAFHEGADYFIPKPLSRERIIDAMQHFQYLPAA